jgi:hypothetical protein
MANSVFVSYRRLDDAIPPGEEREDGVKGFVWYLQAQLKYELSQLGIPGDVLWYDRYKIHAGDDYTVEVGEALRKSDAFLAVVSRNYIEGAFCTAEIQVFSEHLQQMERDATARRIFRADKQFVAKSSLPPQLKDLEPVKFYVDDPDRGEIEYYRRGKVNLRDAYLRALEDLSRSIWRRLVELGVAPRAPDAATTARKENLRRKLSLKDRNIYVSAPTTDTRDEHNSLVSELWARGFNVLPSDLAPQAQTGPPKGHLSQDGAAALAAVQSALAVSEFSIHLLGEMRGFIPDGLNSGIVTMQLLEARQEAQRRPGFRRLIWAPKFLPSVGEDSPPRDPFAVLERFDCYNAGDELFSDTSARFNDFVTQRLATDEDQGSAVHVMGSSSEWLFVAYLPVDELVGLLAAKRLKELAAGRVPLLYGPARDAEKLNRAGLVVVCWGTATDRDLMELFELPPYKKWRAERPGARICLLACSPDSEEKRAAIEVGGFGFADTVVDARSGILPTSAASLLGR